MARGDLPTIFKILKSSLRHHGVTYRDLAMRLAIPESTLKKMLTAKDLSFNRLERICDAAGLDMRDLLDAARERPVKELVFSPKQERLFASMPRCFSVYWQLVYERRSLEEVQAALGIGEADLFKVTRLLDEHSLLRLNSNGSVSVPPIAPVRWGRAGAFTHALKARWGEQVVRDAAGTHGRNQAWHIQYFQLHQDAADELRRELAALEAKYAKLTARDLKLHGTRVQKLRACFAVAEGPFTPE